MLILNEKIQWKNTIKDTIKKHTIKILVKDTIKKAKTITKKKKKNN